MAHWSRHWWQNPVIFDPKRLIVRLEGEGLSAPGRRRAPPDEA